METSLKEKTIKGVGWSAIDKISHFSVTFIVGIVLARLLSPDDFGLLGLTTIFTSVSNTLINGGLVPSLIRKKNATEEDYNTVFVANLVMSTILYCIIFLLSPLIAVFFQRFELVALIRVISLGLLIGPLTIIPSVQMNQRIDFKLIAKISVIGALLSGVIGIVSALAGLGVWALVIQTLSHKMISAILILRMNKWIPQFQFYTKNFNELFGFGWKIMVANIIESIWRELSHIVVGRCYSPATLGQYTRSKQFSNIFSDNLTAVIQRVSFPVLSSIQDDNARLKVAYRKIVKNVMFVSVIGMFFMGAISDSLVYCLIGSKWREAAIYLPLICISGSTYPLQAINLNMIQVRGRSDLFLVLNLIKKIVGIVPLAIGAYVGIMPMLYANLVMCIISLYLNSYYSGILIDYGLKSQIQDVIPSYFMAIMISIPVYFIKYLSCHYWIILIIQLSVGMLLFVLICRLIRPDGYKEIKEFCRIILHN